LFGGGDMAISQKWPLSLGIARKNNHKVAVQINGKTKEILNLDFTPSEEEIIKVTKKNNKISKILLDKEIKRFIYVPNKIINILIS